MMRYYVYRLAGWICPRLPLRLGYWFFARLGDLLFVFARRRQPVYFDNLRHVLGDRSSPSVVNSTARRAFQNLLKNYFDLFRGHSLTAAEMRLQVAAIQGLEHLEQALAQGRGVVAGSAHFGSWDMVLHVAPAYLNAKIVVPNERLRPEKLFRYILALRRSQGIEMVALDNAPRALIKALRAGQVAGLAYDRDLTRSGVRVNFFGVPARLPDGAVQLSLKYGSPVVLGFSVRQPDNRSHIIIEPPLEFERTGNSREDICAGVQKIACVLERYIRRYPDQWLMFQRVWD